MPKHSPRKHEDPGSSPGTCVKQTSCIDGTRGCNPNAREAEASGPLGLVGTLGDFQSVRGFVSENNIDNTWGTKAEAVLCIAYARVHRKHAHKNTHTHTLTCARTRTDTHTQGHKRHQISVNWHS